MWTPNVPIMLVVTVGLLGNIERKKMLFLVFHIERKHALFAVLVPLCTFPRKKVPVCTIGR
jgi:hypothetical protein